MSQNGRLEIDTLQNAADKLLFEAENRLLCAGKHCKYSSSFRITCDAAKAVRRLTGSKLSGWMLSRWCCPRLISVCRDASVDAKPESIYRVRGPIIMPLTIVPLNTHRTRRNSPAKVPSRQSKRQTLHGFLASAHTHPFWISDQLSSRRKTNSCGGSQAKKIKTLLFAPPSSLPGGERYLANSPKLFCQDPLVVSPNHHPALKK